MNAVFHRCVDRTPGYPRVSKGAHFVVGNTALILFTNHKQEELIQRNSSTATDMPMAAGRFAFQSP